MYQENESQERSGPRRHTAPLPSGTVRAVRIVGEGVFWYNTLNSLLTLQDVPRTAGAVKGMPSNKTDR